MVARKCVDSRVDDSAAYLYCASFGAALAFSALFAISTAIHLWQAIHYRKKFCWVIVVAAAWETVGFALRTVSTIDQTKIPFTFPSQILILLGPIWVNAFVYMILGRMVYYLLPDQKVMGVKAGKLALCFVLLDITAFLVQGAGGTIANSDNVKTMFLGIHIYMGGIGLQEFFILLFVGLAINFQKRATREATRPTNWRSLLYVLYAALALITVRIIYRIVEYSAGIHTAITEHEAFFYVLEALPMLIACSLFNVWHPGQVLVGPDSEFPKKEKKAKKAKKDKKDKKSKKVKPEMHQRRLSDEPLVGDDRSAV